MYNSSTRHTAICWRHHSYVFTVLVSNGSTFLTVKEKFRYYEAKIEESEKASSHQKTTQHEFSPDGENFPVDP